MKIKPGILIIASAIIWGLVIIGCSLTLKGTDCYPKISSILFGGVAAHFILIWLPIGKMAKGKKKGDETG